MSRDCRPGIMVVPGYFLYYSSVSSISLFGPMFLGAAKVIVLLHNNIGRLDTLDIFYCLRNSYQGFTCEHISVMSLLEKIISMPKGTAEVYLQSLEVFNGEGKVVLQWLDHVIEYPTLVLLKLHSC